MPNVLKVMIKNVFRECVQGFIHLNFNVNYICNTNSDFLNKLLNDVEIWFLITVILLDIFGYKTKKPAQNRETRYTLLFFELYLDKAVYLIRHSNDCKTTNSIYLFWFD